MLTIGRISQSLFMMGLLFFLTNVILNRDFQDPNSFDLMQSIVPTI